MKALLICPSARVEVPRLCESGPHSTAPILGECLVVHWIEYLAAQGAKEIRILVPEHADAVRAVTGEGGRWGVKLDIRSVPAEPMPAEAAKLYQDPSETDWLPAPNDMVLMDHLPGQPDMPLFGNYARWFAALVTWMPHAISPSRIRMTQAQPGVWTSRRAYVSATATVHAPCWIGDQVYIGPNAVIGPGTILEDRSVIERGANVVQSIVGPDTFVGRLTRVSDSFAYGSMLINWKTGSTLRVPDPFLLCSLHRGTKSSAAVTKVRRSVALFLQKAAIPFRYATAWYERLSDRPASLRPRG